MFLLRWRWAISGAAVVLMLATLSAATQAGQGLLGVGYFVDYDLNSLATISSQGSRLSWVIGAQFSLSGKDGGVSGTHNARMMALARERGVFVHFNVANFLNGEWSREAVHSVLTQSQPRNRTIRDIVALLDKYGYDGASLDFENVSPQDRHALTAFVISLASAVHARGKVLSMAVPAKTRDDLSNNWSGAFDLAALGSAADMIIVMAYDEHWSTSGPGPIASLPWVDAVAQFAAAEVDPRKVLLGVALYGYAWPASGPAEGISMREAVDRAKRAGVTVQWDAKAQVPFYKTSATTVYFENPRSAGRKMEIAKSRGLGGVAFWRLGHELADLWPVVTPYLLEATPIASAP